ncbi:esterase-like activity of phytase family protein [Cellulomonas uda]|uniref:Bacterial Ig-like domain-containing protein n=1 Tax=Cellulomonas uda TaxID=1714 RepID=A0A4Y3K8T2_CELUD|nr:esterase-like activity of phytase family protein [Cellulomonas uda]GEA80881.1 hypothetical protein CUD01_13250 [Cellulomonas uda]
MLPAHPHRARPVRTTVACVLVGTLAATALVVAPATATTAPATPLAAALAPAPGWSDDGWTPPSPDATFHRLATYPVYLNRPAGAPASDVTVAEISAVSDDGRTFVHTDALARRIGFVDVTDPARPVGAGTLDLAADLGVGAHAEPTSVAVVGGYVLVVVDTSPSFTAPSGALVVVDLATHDVVRTLELGGQPDSIALTPDRAHAAIAIENQRDEDARPAGGAKGDLPQLPGGFLQLLDLPDRDDPATWALRAVPFTDGTQPLPAFVAAGLDTPQDPEPEYVAVDPSGATVAVTLQENNGVVLVDVASGEVTRVFSAGSQALTGVDTAKDGVVDQSGTLPARPREPDAVAWLDATHVATANEGDWKGGTRGWSVFDVTTGEVVWDAGASLERLAVRVGLHTEDRAGKKGVEIEGLAVATFGGTPYAFVGSERSNFVAVYDVSDPTRPVFSQVLATTNGPEGILPVPSRDLLIVSSETDTPAAGVRSAVTVLGRGAQHAPAAGTPAFPSVVSADASGAPIGWGALGALAADRRDAQRLWTATDAAYADTRLLSLDVSGTPAVIDRQLRVTEHGEGVSLDVEGVATRRAGGFWLGVEGATGAGNQLVRTNAYGAVVERVTLPADVAAGLTKWGVEGVTTVDDASGEHVWVALQRGLTSDPGGLGGTARLGRYDVADGSWSWFGYPLSSTDVAGDWVGLSEVVAVDADTLAVVERDKLNGPSAAVKRVYTVDVPADPAPGAVAPLTKTLAHDVLPDLRATAGWTQEKLEGLTIAGDGTVWAVTDNDGLADATGETALLDLGSRTSVFGRTASTTTAQLAATSTYGTAARVAVTVTGGATPPTGTVQVREGSRVLASATLDASGRARLTLPATLRAGTHRLTVAYAGTADVAASQTPASLRVTRAEARVRLGAASWHAARGSRPTIVVDVTGAGRTPSGKVSVAVGGRTVATRALRDGRLVLALPRVSRTATVTVRYAGSADHLPASASRTLTVR